MANARGQGRKPKASTIVERALRNNRQSSLRGIPHPPDHLSETERVEWRKVARLLKDAGLLDSLDKTLLAAYCTVYARWVDAEGKLKTIGVLVKDKDGMPVKSPYLGIANTCLKQMMSMLGELGMTPASRSRLPKREMQDRPRRTTARHVLDPREILEHCN